MSQLVHTAVPHSIRPGEAPSTPVVGSGACLRLPYNAARSVATGGNALEHPGHGAWHGQDTSTLSSGKSPEAVAPPARCCRISVGCRILQLILAIGATDETPKQLYCASHTRIVEQGLHCSTVKERVVSGAKADGRGASQSAARYGIRLKVRHDEGEEIIDLWGDAKAPVRLAIVVVVLEETKENAEMRKKRVRTSFERRSAGPLQQRNCEE